MQRGSGDDGSPRNVEEPSPSRVARPVGLVDRALPARPGRQRRPSSRRQIVMLNAETRETKQTILEPPIQGQANGAGESRPRIPKRPAGAETEVARLSRKAAEHPLRAILDYGRRHRSILRRALLFTVVNKSLVLAPPF